MLKNQMSLTEGGVPRQMLLFTVPVFCSNLFQQLYNAADSLIVGNFLGRNALASVSSSASLIMLMVGFFNGVAMGAGVLIARFFGAEDEENLRRAVHTTVALGLVASVLLTVLGVAFTPQILRWMGTPADVLEGSVSYFRVYFFGVSAVVLYNIGASILQSVGDSRSPMIYLIAASLINVVLDLIFVGVFRLGVASAALATVISQTFSAVLAFRKLMTTDEPYRVSLRELKMDLPMLRQVVTQGVPSGVQNSVISLANVVVQSNINAFGANAMAGCGSYAKVEGFAFLPVGCFALALSTFVSQNIGARKFDRVRSGMKFGVACSVVMAELVGLGVFLLAPVLIGAFNNDPAVVAFGVRDARTVALFYCLLAFSHCCAGVLRGMGRPIVPMVIMLAVWCVFRVSYITAAVHFIPDIQVVWLAYPITWTISSILFAVFLARSAIPGERAAMTR